MLGFNSEFQNGTKITKVWIELALTDGTSLEYNEERVSMNGFVRDTSTTVDGQFTVGAAVTGKATVILDNSDDALSNYDFRDAVMVAWLGGVLSDESIEKINVGRYYVDEYSYDGSNVTLVAYDDMSKFDMPCKDTSFTFRSNTTVSNLVGQAISCAETVSLYNSTLPTPSAFYIPQQPEQWDTMTWHDVIAYCAQIMCCFAHIVYENGVYYLKFQWYDTGPLTTAFIDGGTFNHPDDSYVDGSTSSGGTFETSGTPYTDGDTQAGGTFAYTDGDSMSGGSFSDGVLPYPDGDVLDGGVFDPWNDGNSADAGIIGDRANMHVLPSPYDMSVDTDDVLITGVTVILPASDNINANDDTEDFSYTLGDAGYIIQITNPLIETTAYTMTVCSHLYNYLSGIRFRPLNASAVEDPSIEAGDTAYITGRNDKPYACFISHATYTVNSATSISCDAESGKQNLKGRYTGTQKTQALIQRNYERTMTSAETAMSGILGALSTTMGLKDFSYTDSGGNKIYLFGNGNTRATSEIQWRFSAGALMVSSDYGSHWNAALSANGIAVLQEVYAVKVNADNIETGSLRITNGTDTIFNADVDAGTVEIGGFTVDSLSLRYNKTSLYSTDTGVFIGPAGISVGDFRVYPSMNTVSGNAIGTVMFGNVTFEYSWSIQEARELDIKLDDLDITAAGKFYVNVGNDYHVISMEEGNEMHISASNDIYIHANGGLGTVYIDGTLVTSQ